MTVNFDDYRRITIVVNSNKDIVIFPKSESKIPETDDNGTILGYACKNTFFPIELKFPYSEIDLAHKIQYGIEEFGKHECYELLKPTLEEKYYGVKGFKNAVKGCRLIDLGWDNIFGKYVSLQIPMKSVYAYIGIDNIKLQDDADWTDYAKSVINYIDSDLSTFSSFKRYKSKLNI